MSCIQFCRPAPILRPFSFSRISARRQSRIPRSDRLSLVKTPSALKILTLRASVGRLLIHDRSTFSAGFIDKILTQESNRACPRKSRLAAATCHFESQTPSAPTEEARPPFLGLPFCNLAEMARIPPRGQARNSHSVASERICIVLDPSFKMPRTRSTGNRQ
jgi:hypothetical protein